MHIITADVQWFDNVNVSAINGNVMADLKFYMP